MTRMPMRYGLLELPAIRPAVFSFCLLFYYYYVFFFVYPSIGLSCKNFIFLYFVIILCFFLYLVKR